MIKSKMMMKKIHTEICCSHHVKKLKVIIITKQINIYILKSFYSSPHFIKFFFFLN